MQHLPQSVIIENVVIQRFGVSGTIVSKASFLVRRGEDISNIPRLSFGTCRQNNFIIGAVMGGIIMQYQDLFDIPNLLAHNPPQH